MRILHVVHQYLPEYIGGTELYTRWLAEGASQKGHHVSVFYRRSAKDHALDKRQDEGGLQVWAASAGPVTPNRRFLATFGDKVLSAAFQQVLDQTKPDIIHLQHMMGLPASLIDQICDAQIPYVITLHDYWWICANAQLFTNYSQEICQGPKAYLNCARCALARADRTGLWPTIPGIAALLARRNRLLQPVLQEAQTIIAPSQFVADWYADHGLARQKLRVIPHGLPVTPLPPQADLEPDRSLRFAYIGGLSHQKGVHLLIEAFGALENKAELWIAGDEAAEPDYTARLRQMAGSAVRFLGRLTRPQVWETLAQVDVIIVPSLWYETFSFIVSEAFAAGVPVVASQLGSLAERVRHEVDGLLVPPNDSQSLAAALSRFLQEPTLLPKLRDGIMPVQSIEGYVDQILDIYASL